MPLKTGILEEPRIDLTPMLDCVMLLIIFFMVGTQFTSEERSVEVQLPTASDAAALTPQPDAIVVNVLQSGEVRVKEQPLTLDELLAQLTAAQQNFPGQAVIIRGDGAGRYQAIMDCLTVCRKAEIRNIQLANRPEGE